MKIHSSNNGGSHEQGSSMLLVTAPKHSIKSAKGKIVFQFSLQTSFSSVRSKHSFCSGGMSETSNTKRSRQRLKERRKSSV